MIPNLPIPTVPGGYAPGTMRSLGASGWGCHSRNPSGQDCFLKFLRFDCADAASAAFRARQDLLALGAIAGLIRLRASGWDSGSLTVWEELEPVDHPPSRPDDPPMRGAETLADRIRSEGEWSTHRVIDFGRRLCRTLARLHGSGFVHGDIKPANCLFVGGEPILADLGSLHRSDSTIPTGSTPGYRPVIADQPADLDLVALGKTLYEIWTGRNRYHFPSLPSRLLESSDWRLLGWRLNRVLLQVVDPRPSKRPRSADEMEAHLAWAARGGRRWSRRDAVALGIAAAGMGLGFHVLRKRPAFAVRWERLPPLKFGSETWTGSAHSVDWTARRVYSLETNLRLGLCYQGYSLESWGREERSWKRLPAAGQCVRDPGSGHLWASTESTGELIRVDPRDPKPEELSVAPFEHLNFSGPAYWNPITRRPGRFAGYGDFRLIQRRWEWDSHTRLWTEQTHRDPAPWPRRSPLLVPCQEPGRLWYFGGRGNRSGIQGEVDHDLPNFDGHWNQLDDLWRLDLASGRWTRHFGFGCFDAAKVAALAPMASGDQILFLERSVEGSWSSPKVFVGTTRPTGEPPAAAMNLGKPPSLFRIWMALSEPDREAALVFDNIGVFRVTLKRL